MAELHGNPANVQKTWANWTPRWPALATPSASNQPQADTWHNLLLTLQYADHACAADCAHWHRAFAEQFEAPGAVAWPPTNSREPERQLRGLVSADFAIHSVSHFRPAAAARWPPAPTWAWAVRLQPGPGARPTGKQQLEACCAKWRHVLGLNDDSWKTASAGIRSASWLTLSGHTANNRLPVFARKPAPIYQWAGWATRTAAG